MHCCPLPLDNQGDKATGAGEDGTQDPGDSPASDSRRVTPLACIHRPVKPLDGRMVECAGIRSEHCWQASARNIASKQASVWNIPSKHPFGTFMASIRSEHCQHASIGSEDLPMSCHWPLADGWPIKVRGWGPAGPGPVDESERLGPGPWQASCLSSALNGKIIPA